jgi:hypothetical protein
VTLVFLALLIEVGALFGMASPVVNLGYGTSMPLVN